MTGHYRLAERLGAEVATLSGQDVAATLLEYARSCNVTKILIGKTDSPRWKRLFFNTIVDEVLDRSGDIDVYVIRGEGQQPHTTPPRRSRSSSDWRPYLKGGVILAIGSLVATGFERLGRREANVVMAFIAALALVSSRYGRGPAVAASIAAV
jgi:two-component system sensor histidine kinase KdpD